MEIIRDGSRKTTRINSGKNNWRQPSKIGENLGKSKKLGKSKRIKKTLKFNGH